MREIDPLLQNQSSLPFLWAIFWVELCVLLKSLADQGKLENSD